MGEVPGEGGYTPFMTPILHSIKEEDVKFRPHVGAIPKVRVNEEDKD